MATHVRVTCIGDRAGERSGSPARPGVL